VDIIFCLCVFFMISFKFKQLEGKFDTWLPKDKGYEGMPLKAVIQEIRVALLWDDKKSSPCASRHAHRARRRGAAEADHVVVRGLQAPEQARHRPHDRRDVASRGRTSSTS
jgi:hypothetical protein